jgi:hypothetical protein
MARTLINPTISIDGTDVTVQGSKVIVKKDRDELDGTGFGSEFKQTEPGLKDAAVEMTLFQTYGAGSVNSLLSTLEEEDKAVPVIVTPKQGVVSADNPAFALMAGKAFGYNPLEASGPGQLGSTDVNFKNVGEEGVQELITPKEVEEAEEG